MRAAYYEGFGTARDVLKIGPRELAPPGTGEVRIRVVVSGVNPSDVKSRAGLISRGPLKEPIVPHSDGTGIIDAVGEGVPATRLGERVWTWNAQWKRMHGTAAEYVVLPAEQAVRLPEGTSFEAGACLGIPAITAHRAVTIGSPVKGQVVLVSGGAGAVGAYAVQLAKLNGAIVIATVSSDEKAEYVRSIGADHILNYRQDNVLARVKELTSGQGVDRIIEVDFAANKDLVQRALRPHGTAVVYGSSANESPFSVMAYARFNQTLHGILCYDLLDTDRQRAISDLTEAMQAGSLQHRVSARFPLDEIVAAHEAVESGKVIGNVVVRLIPDPR